MLQVSVKEKDVSLLTVYVQEFPNDHYHRFETDPPTELEREVRSIRRRYRDVSDYNRARLIYDTYMDILAEKYGGWELFRIRLKSGVISDYIPPKPGIKVNELNKLILKSGIVLSKRTSSYIDFDVVEELVEYYPDAEVQHVGNDQILFEEASLTKDERKTLEREVKSGDYKIRQGARAKTAPKIQYANSVEFLNEYMLTRTATEQKKPEEELSFTLSDYYDGSYMDKLVDYGNDRQETVFFRGQYLDANSAEEMSVYRSLGELGWDATRIMRESGVSKKIAKTLGGDKKDKKKAKADKKKQAERDEVLLQLIDDGNFDDFAQYQSEAQDFTAASVFGRQ